LDLAERLAAYACGLEFSDLDPVTVRETRRRTVDAFGCALGAYREDPVRIARRASLPYEGAGASTILGTAERTTPDVAAFVNGLMVRYFDFNDTYLSKEPAHPSDNIAAALAVAESVGASGSDLVLATALAYEVQCRLCDSADIRHRGWDHVCYGLVSAALAAAKLMGLDERKAAQAVNISLSAHIAMRQVRAGELSMWKGASFANAARNAVFAARLAKEGMTGPSPVFEGEMGFFHQVSGPFDLDVSRFGRGGRGFKVPETYIKFYPAEYHAQTAVQAAIELSGSVGPMEEVEEVRISTHEAGYTILGKDREKWAPTTKETADHSLPFMVGSALMRGKLENSSYSPEGLTDPNLKALLERVRVHEDAALTALYPANGMPNRVEVFTRDGRNYSREHAVPKGHPLNPMTDDEVELKFRGLTATCMSQTEQDELLDALWEVDSLPEARALLELSRVRTPD
jgi:2-methylcitrate dehydratase